MMNLEGNKNQCVARFYGNGKQEQSSCKKPLRIILSQISLTELQVV